MFHGRAAGSEDAEEKEHPGTGCSQWATDNVARRAISCLFLCSDVVRLGFCPSSGEWALTREHGGWGLLLVEAKAATVPDLHPPPGLRLLMGAGVLYKPSWDLTSE